MDDRYDISVDIGEGSDFVVLHLIEYKNGEIGCNYIVSNVKVMEEKKTIKEWKEAFADLYKAMRKELGASDLDVHVFQSDVKPVVNFDIKF